MITTADNAENMLRAMQPKKKKPERAFVGAWAEKAGKRQVDIVRATGADKSLVSRWFRENVLPTEPYIQSLAQLLGIDRSDLYRHPDDVPSEAPHVMDVPRVSWVTAGELGDQAAAFDFSDFPMEAGVDLPSGRYIALKVEAGANSMNKISPPESIIFVNLDDRRLVPNACYVIADEQGRATYKRYRPNENPVFQPASYEEVEPPTLDGAITVVGRVRRSQIDM